MEKDSIILRFEFNITDNKDFVGVFIVYSTHLPPKKKKNGLTAAESYFI